jgi:hypothetical protein
LAKSEGPSVKLTGPSGEIEGPSGDLVALFLLPFLDDFLPVY